MNLFEISESIVYYKSSENMEELKDNSIQLIVTSPPYGKIKDYGIEEQIGFYDSFEDYFTRLKKVWDECYRVLEPQCRMVINIGDQYLRTAKFGRYRILSIASKIIDNCTELGFDFLGDIIWQKISTTNTTGGCSLMGSIYYPRNGLLTFDYEHILIFKKHEGKVKKITRERKELSKISLSEWKKWYVGHWRFPGIMQKEHIAMFPEELPYRIIRMFSFVGDTVLDPFLGSGTTLKVAKSLFRKGIGYEINEEYKNIITTKIKEGYAGYFNDYQYLIYNIFNKANIEGIDIKVDDQKQKGIMILKDSEGIEVLFDYLYIDDDTINNNFFSREIKSKFEENTIQYYINDKEKWDHFVNYIVVINSNSKKEEQIFSQLKKFLDSSKITKSFSFVSLKNVISDKFLLRELFKRK
jgi:DNA modification methylase